MNQQIAPFVSETHNLVRLNTKWQQQLKAEKERIRQILITGNYDNTDDTLDYNAVNDVLVTSINANHHNLNTLENYGSIPPVIVVATSYPAQRNVADEYTLNREQRAAFMIITSHLEGNKLFQTGMFHIIHEYKQK